jgi:D-erythro-7,8-dihydroneopterin triphosphate epimerase
MGQKERNPATWASALATIAIRNLRLRTFVGFNPEEKIKKQDIVLNIEIRYRARPGVREDRVSDALDYKVVTKRVIELVETGRFLLLEKLVADVLGACREHPDVRHVRVTADKPHALRFADSVSLTMESTDDVENSFNYLEKVS